METIKIALKEYGAKEIAGIFHSAEILKYFKQAGFKSVKDDETAWCAAFVNWVLLKAGRQTTNSLMARSFLKWGAETSAPGLGDVAVFWRISPTSIYGHVGFFIRETNNIVYVLGGNQSDMVNITGYPKAQLLAYRTPAQTKRA